MTAAGAHLYLSLFTSVVLSWQVCRPWFWLLLIGCCTVVADHYFCGVSLPCRAWSAIYLSHFFGFIVLSALLVSSLFFSTSIWMTGFLLGKTILVLLAWLIFAVLLLGRYYGGWRGRRAVMAPSWCIPVVADLHNCYAMMRS